MQDIWTLLLLESDLQDGFATTSRFKTPRYGNSVTASHQHWANHSVPQSEI